MDVRPMTPSDAEAWLGMRHALWPEGSREEHRGEIARHFRGEPMAEPSAALLAEQNGRSVGLVELSVRPCAEGCATDRVAYVEGWYVLPEARRRGVGRALLEAAEAWGREQGCTELASDTQESNRASRAAHLAFGFEDAGLVRCFRKDL